MAFAGAAMLWQLEWFLFDVVRDKRWAGGAGFALILKLAQSVSERERRAQSVRGAGRRSWQGDTKDRPALPVRKEFQADSNRVKHACCVSLVCAEDEQEEE